MTGPEPTMDELVLALRRALAGMQLYITKTEARSILTAVLPRVLEGEREACAKVAEEWEPVERLLPLCDDDANRAAHTGQYEAGERIAEAIRARSVHSHIDSLLKGET